MCAQRSNRFLPSLLPAFLIQVLGDDLRFSRVQRDAVTGRKFPDAVEGLPISESNANAAEVKHSPDQVQRLAGTSWKPCLATLAIVLLTIVVLRLEGRVWWCACGQWNLWADAQSSHSSQHLFDPYSFTHILHGVLICGLFALGLPRIDRAWALPVAVLLEAAWEILENSPFIIDRYRTPQSLWGIRATRSSIRSATFSPAAWGFYWRGASDGAGRSRSWWRPN